MLGMPRIEIEFESSVLANAVFSTLIYLQHIARPVESDHPINIVFVRPSVLP